MENHMGCSYSASSQYIIETMNINIMETIHRLQRFFSIIEKMKINTMETIYRLQHFFSIIEKMKINIMETIYT